MIIIITVIMVMVTPRVNSNNSFDDNLSLQLRRENSWKRGFVV